MTDPVVILELQQCNVKNAVLHDLKLMCQMSIFIEEAGSVYISQIASVVTHVF